MNMDVLWTQIRNLLVAMSGILVGLGVATNVEVMTFIDKVGQIIVGVGAVVYVITTAWQWWVRWNTRAVPMNIAERPSIPTVNPATGTLEGGEAVTHKKES